MGFFFSPLFEEKQNLFKQKKTDTTKTVDKKSGGEKLQKQNPKQTTTTTRQGSTQLALRNKET